MKKVTLNPALKSVKALIEGTARFTLGQITVEVEEEHLNVVPIKTDNFGATELCGFLQHPLAGYFTIRGKKVVLLIYSRK